MHVVHLSGASFCSSARNSGRPRLPSDPNLLLRSLPFQADASSSLAALCNLRIQQQLPPSPVLRHPSRLLPIPPPLCAYLPARPSPRTAAFVHPSRLLRPWPPSPLFPQSGTAPPSSKHPSDQPSSWARSRTSSFNVTAFSQPLRRAHTRIPPADGLPHPFPLRRRCKTQELDPRVARECTLVRAVVGRMEPRDSRSGGAGSRRATGHLLFAPFLGRHPRARSHQRQVGPILVCHRGRCARRH